MKALNFLVLPWCAGQARVKATVSGLTGELCLPSFMTYLCVGKLLFPINGLPDWYFIIKICVLTLVAMNQINLTPEIAYPNILPVTVFTTLSVYFQTLKFEVLFLTGTTPIRNINYQ